MFPLKNFYFLELKYDENKKLKMKTIDSISPENVTNSVKIKNFSKYGRYSVKDRLELEFPNTKIIISSIDNEKFSYQRTNSENESTNKIISAKGAKLEIEVAPVIPVNLPKHKRQYPFYRGQILKPYPYRDKARCFRKDYLV